MDKFEVRSIPVTELRIEGGEGNSPVRISGHAAVFNTMSQDLGGFREIIRPGTFTRTLANNPDVMLLVDHEGAPLARTSNRSLTLREDQRGLFVQGEIYPQDDPDAARMVGKMKRGLMGQMSFAFRTIKDSWRTENGESIRELLDVELDGGDVSVVGRPAYRATDVALRSMESWKKSQEKPVEHVPAPSLDTLRMRIELAEQE